MLREMVPCDTSWKPFITCCRRRNLSTWDTVNTITGEALPYAESEQKSLVREAWVGGQYQDAVAPPQSPRQIDKELAVQDA